MLNFVGEYYEIAIVGENAHERIAELNKTYIPNKLIVGSKGESNLYLLENRYTEGETMIYVCVEGACKLPVTTAADAINQLDLKIK